MIQFPLLSQAGLSTWAARLCWVKTAADDVCVVVRTALTEDSAAWAIRPGRILHRGHYHNYVVPSAEDCGHRWVKLKEDAADQAGRLVRSVVHRLRLATDFTGQAGTSKKRCPFSYVLHFSGLKKAYLGGLFSRGRRVTKSHPRSMEVNPAGPMTCLAGAILGRISSRVLI